MKVYFAGNFPQMSKVKTEYQVMKRAAERSEFRRLISYCHMEKKGEHVVMAINRYRKMEQRRKQDESE